MILESQDSCAHSHIPSKAQLALDKSCTKLVKGVKSPTFPRRWLAQRIFTVLPGEGPGFMERLLKGTGGWKGFR